jgi:hypothetical protein
MDGDCCAEDLIFGHLSPSLSDAEDISMSAAFLDDDHERSLGGEPPSSLPRPNLSLLLQFAPEGEAAVHEIPSKSRSKTAFRFSFISHLL